MLTLEYLVCVDVTAGLVQAQQRRERVQMQEEAINTAIIQETEEELQQINKSLYKVLSQTLELPPPPCIVIFMLTVRVAYHDEPACVDRCAPMM